MNWLQASRIPFLFMTAGSVWGFRFGFQESKSVASSKESTADQALLENELRMPNLVGELEERLQGVSIEPDREESSCYSRIFGALTHPEKSAVPEPSLCSVLGRSEAHRTAFAARLTICELETNRLTLPRECSLWIEAGSEPTSEKLQACVGALHASPQSWSSFTGHQREAVQLCFAHHKLQGIELATSLNLKTIKFSTDMIRLSRLDHQSNQEDLRNLRDHMRNLFDQSLRNLDSVSEHNRQESQKLFRELENGFQDVKTHLYERNQQMWKEFHSHQNQQIENIQDRVQSLNNNNQLILNDNVNNFILSMKEEVEQKIQSSLDSAAAGMIANLKQAFEVESRSNSVNVNHQIKEAFEAALDLATHRHHQGLEESIVAQSQRMACLFEELLSVENILSSMKQNLDSMQITSSDRESTLRESTAKIEEQQRKGEELIHRFMESMATHQAMIQTLTDTVSDSPFFIFYSFFKTGFIPSLVKKLSISKLKIVLGWVVWFAWMSGGMNWILRIGLVRCLPAVFQKEADPEIELDCKLIAMSAQSKAIVLFFFLTVRLPLRWLRRKMSSETLSSKQKDSEAHRKNGSLELSQQVVKKRSQDSNVSPPNDDDQRKQSDSPRQVFLSSSRSVDGLQSLRQGNLVMRRKFSSQSLHGGSRIVPTRLIGNNFTADHGGSL